MQLCLGQAGQSRCIPGTGWWLCSDQVALESCTAANAMSARHWLQGRQGQLQTEPLPWRQGRNARLDVGGHEPGLGHTSTPECVKGVCHPNSTAVTKSPWVWWQLAASICRGFTQPLQLLPLLALPLLSLPLPLLPLPLPPAAAVWCHCCSPRKSRNAFCIGGCQSAGGSSLLIPCQ